MQNKLTIALSSPAFWGVVILFVINSLKANLILIPADWLWFANAIIGLATAYLQTTHVQNAAQLGSTKFGFFKN